MNFMISKEMILSCSKKNLQEMRKMYHLFYFFILKISCIAFKRIMRVYDYLVIFTNIKIKFMTELHCDIT